MHGHGKRERHARSEAQTGAVDLKAPNSLTKVRLKNFCDDFPKFGSLPMLPCQNIVRSCQCEQALLKRLEVRTGLLANITEALGRYRLHCGERVLHPVIE